MNDLCQIENDRFGPTSDSCQNELLPSGTSRVHRAVVLAGQVRFYLKHRGTLPAIRKVFSFLISTAASPARLSREKLTVLPQPSFSEVLDLQPGELVEVRSENEIRDTLDAEGRNRGLTFTPDMREYCGRRLRVFKRVQRICLEGRPGEMRSLNNTVILEGAICNGGSRSCDRSCFFFWREAWLRRIN